MPSTAFASITDLESRWRRLSPAESSVAATLLEDAAVIIRRHCDIISGDAAQSAALVIVSCNMVRRAMEAHTDAFGFDDSGAEVWTPMNPAGGLRLYDSEAAMIDGAASGVFSVRASR